MTRFIKIIALLFFFSCNQQEERVEHKKTTSIETNYTDKYDTLPNGKKLLDTYDSAMQLYYKEVVGSDTLKGGGITCYGIDDSMRYFYLRNGNMLHLLNQSTNYQSPWSLGRLHKDFKTFFMTIIDNGNGCPCTYKLFDKKNGKNILGNKIEAISYTYLQDTLFMLYDNWAKNEKDDSIMLFNVTTKRRERYKLPNNLPEYCAIEIGKLTKKNLSIMITSYVGDYFESSKTYKR